MERRRVLVVSLCLVFVSGLTAHAVEFAGGTGEPNDPYQIATAEQLMSIVSGSGLQDKHFILIADIDMDPNLVGRFEVPLVLSGGSLDGDGHRLFNFHPRFGFRGDSGMLFKSLGPNAVVRNLSVEGIYAGGSQGAMLVGTNEGLIVHCYVDALLEASTSGGLAIENLGTIADCSVAGSVAGFVGSQTGGLVAVNSGTILNCHSTANVIGGDGLVGDNSGTIVRCGSTGNVTNGGGLVGTNSGTIMNCRSTANVTTGSGLVRRNLGTIVACYATGDVTNGSAGLVGDNLGTIRYCCAAGDVHTTGDLAGGLVGANSGEVLYCCALGNVSAGNEAAGLVASNTGTISCCYAMGGGGMALVAKNDRDAIILCCYALAEADGGGIDDGLGVPLASAEMRRRECFIGWDFAGTQVDGSLDPWMMPAEGGYPMPTAIHASELPGTGTIDDPYLIQTHHQFMAIQCEPRVCYRLVADIDLQGQSFSEPLIPTFLGRLDGAGHSVFNFTLTGRYDIGLLGTIGSEAAVSNLHLCNLYAVIAAAEGKRAGALAACNRGTVTDCSVAMEMTVAAGDVTYHAGALIGVNEGGTVHRCSSRLRLMYDDAASRGFGSYCGGLIGHNTGAVSQCRSSAYTSIETKGFGALIGRNEGGIMDCYADGYLRGYNVAGLAYSNSGSITNCYAAAAIPAGTPAAGLVVENPGGSITSAYFLAEADGGGPDNGYGTALSHGQMQQQASFSGWDFGEVWTICEGTGYPRLRWEGAGCEP